MSIAEELARICNKLDIALIFKASFRKANRSSVDSFEGIGDKKAIGLLMQVRHEFKIPVTTDVHEVNDLKLLPREFDLIQIPAFLCRQTSLLVEAGKFSTAVNIKKGQFMSAHAMKFAVEKVVKGGASDIMVTERGNSFGYGDLVVDFRNIPRLKQLGILTVTDCTHSLQEPNKLGGITGGDPRFVQSMANAATAVGSDGLFIETHTNPRSGLSDSATMLSLSQMESLLSTVKKIKKCLIV